MEYSGLIQKYKINRPLTDEERELQLKQKQKLDVEPHYAFSVIKVNSTYMELADKYYGWRGFLTLGMLVCLFATLLFPGLVAFDLLTRTQIPSAQMQEADTGAIVMILVLLLPLAAFIIWALRKEAFHLTHFPVRLNRKTRMVHLFRPDRSGTILSVPWDEVFFTLCRGQSLGYWDIRGHVLDTDKITVKESFALGMPWADRDALLRNWEFMRRYMEDGPQGIVDLIPGYWPISTHREPWIVGLQRLLLNFPGSFIVHTIMLPAYVLFSFGRVIANRTSSIPQWPAEIEATCPIEPGDPFERDERNNKVNRIGWLV